MSGSSTRRRMIGLASGALLAGLALTGCTSPPAAPPSPTPPATSAAPSPSASAASPSTSASPSAAPSESSAPDALTIDITIAGGQVTPNGKKVDVAVGQPVVLNVTSDEDDEVHAHTDDGEGYELAVPAGKKVSGTFSVGAPGSYEVESHHLEKVIVILNAR